MFYIFFSLALKVQREWISSNRRESCGRVLETIPGLAVPCQDQDIREHFVADALFHPGGRRVGVLLLLLLPLKHNSFELNAVVMR